MTGTDAPGTRPTSSLWTWKAAAHRTATTGPSWRSRSSRLPPASRPSPRRTPLWSTRAAPSPPWPWIAPGLTNDVLSHARLLTAIEPELANCISGRWLVGHNIGVDRRLR